MPLRITLKQFPSPGERSAPFEFHIRASVRSKYGFDDTLYGFSGNVIFANFRAVRVFAQKMNAKRDLLTFPGQAVRAGQLNAMGLIDEIFHYLLRSYEGTNPGVFSRALSSLNSSVGKNALEISLLEFCRQFPAGDVHRRAMTAEGFLAATTEHKPHSEVVLEEMILLSLANINPAFMVFKELFDDRDLREHTVYASMMSSLEEFFRTEKPFGRAGQSILELLRAPILASPHSLQGQLAYIKEHWGLLLGDRFRRKLLGAGDLLEEDSRSVQPGMGGPPPVPRYSFAEEGYPADGERFTADLDWMPNVVIMAKNVYVWLEQLSRRYGRHVSKLSEIPDEELDTLSRWNFTGLWLIGVWERSPASQKIKQLSGNPEAVSSAYSVYDYEIALELGGEEAFQQLRHRAWARGIRLAGDMVPNHVGIYSRWLVEHPEFFIQSDYPPFPNYQFTGPNLSDSPDVEIRIEDGYWSRRDAAVAFQRLDRRSGHVRYIYHGNDGTSMPWNDTAQLNFLRGEVREAVIRTIFHVARKFSIIRFDAAMVLTKRHFHRLWFPQPGSGGAIPSRSDFSLPAEDFNRLFPQEFWREVVDRINAEMPNTLLLAEAFWLLEGYFVRTLGMHRVYNSAFMHMLMREENAKYRHLIRITLHFNPEILKRYVNFMSNPDEETAVAQFGKGDKYFGTAVLLATLPGLPMFAHGQIEGFSEKYGMEYKKAYHDEVPDEHVVRRHVNEVFPLLERRRLFSQVSHFELFDFIDSSGNLNENVIAFSNMNGDERAVICFHNKFEETSGWIKNSVGKTTSGTADEEGKYVAYRTIGDALRLKRSDPVFYVFRDYRSNLDFIRSGRDLTDKGLFLDLKAFEYHIFLDFREVRDSDGRYAELCGRLNGKGVPDIRRSLREMELAPFHDALSKLFDAVPDLTRLASSPQPADSRILRENISECLRAVIREANRCHPGAVKGRNAQEIFDKSLRSVQDIYGRSARPTQEGRLMKSALPDMSNDPAGPLILMALLALSGFQSRPLLDELEILPFLTDLFGRMRVSRDPRSLVRLICVLLFDENPFDSEALGPAFFEGEEVRMVVNVNCHSGIFYYHKESFERLLEWHCVRSLIGRLRSGKARDLRPTIDMFHEWAKLSAEAHYQVNRITELIARSAETVEAE